MNGLKARSMIADQDVSGVLGNDERDFFLEVIDALDTEVFDAGTFRSRGFEGSFVEGSPKIRLLHLEFPMDSFETSEIQNIRKCREDMIIGILRMAEQRFSCRYDVDFCETFFAFNTGNGAFPVQVGMEYESGIDGPRLKVYLSINAGPFPLEAFCALSGIDNADTIRFLQGKRFDTVAVDFLPNGKVAIKFYPLISENKGLLLRISYDGSMSSKKSWIRFPQGIDVGNVSKSGFFDVPLFLRDHIGKSRMKVHYICLENGKRSIYFR